MDLSSGVKKNLHCSRAVSYFHTALMTSELTDFTGKCHMSNLFVLIQKCILPCFFQSHLKEIQVAFISVLSDPDGKFSWRDVFFLLLNWSAHYNIVCSHPSLLLFFGSELSQDVASKGLGLVYEMGGEVDQQELVSTLVETLMTGKRWVDE